MTDEKKIEEVQNALNKPPIEEQVKKYIAGDFNKSHWSGTSSDMPDFGTDAFVEEYLKQSSAMYEKQEGKE